MMQGKSNKAMPNSRSGEPTVKNSDRHPEGAEGDQPRGRSSAVGALGWICGRCGLVAGP